MSQMCEKKRRKISVDHFSWDEIVNGRCPVRGIHSSEQGIPPTAAPLRSVSPTRRPYSKSHYGECSWTGRQTGSSQRLSSRRVRHVVQRSTILPQPSSHSGVCSMPGRDRRQKPGLGWRGQGTAWLGQGAVGWLHVCTIFKGPTCSLHQLITEVQVKGSMRVNSISAEEKTHVESQLVKHFKGNSAICTQLNCIM